MKLYFSQTIAKNERLTWSFASTTGYMFYYVFHYEFDCGNVILYCQQKITVNEI